MDISTHTKPLLLAHRGDIANYPENTLKAFVSAFEKGADGVEMDIHLHKKDIIVVHPYTFDRKATYPKLIDVLEKIQAKGTIEIEIKSFTASIIDPLTSVLNQFPTSDYRLSTSEIPLARVIKESFPTIPFDLILHDFLFQDWMNDGIVEEKLTGWAGLTKADGVCLSHDVLRRFGKESLVKALHKIGLTICSHIYDTEGQRQILSDLTLWQVDQCTVDNIGLLITTANTS